MVHLVALASALMQDKQVRGCVADSGKTPEAYVSRAFKLEQATLADGARITAAVATDGCMAQGQAIRVLVYRETGGSYRLVLDAFAMDPEIVNLPSDGTITLPAHETIDTIIEQTFVWNGTRYVVDPFRSHEYDVGLEQRRPYQTLLRFAPGTSSAILRGTTALNFGDTYAFRAHGGQRISIRLLDGTGKPPPAIYLNCNEKTIADVDPPGWAGTLPPCDMYTLDFLGGDKKNHDVLVPYVVRLDIH